MVLSLFKILYQNLYHRLFHAHLSMDLSWKKKSKKVYSLAKKRMVRSEKIWIVFRNPIISAAKQVFTRILP